MKLRDTVKILTKAYGGYKRQIAILVSLGFFGAMFEGIGVTMLIPIFSRFTGAAAPDDIISRLLGDVLGWFGLGFAFKALLVIIVLAFIIKSLFLLVSAYITARITADYEKETRAKLVGGLLEANWPFITRQKSGFLEAILVKDVEEASRLLSGMGEWIIYITSMLVYTVIAFTISPTISMLSLAIGGFTFLLLKPFFYQIKELAGRQAKAISDMNHYVGESVFGIKTVKASLAAESILGKANEYFMILRNAHIKIKVLGRFPALLAQPLSIVFAVTLFAFLYLTENFQLGVFAVIIYLIQRIFTHIQNIQGALYGFNVRVPYLIRVVGFGGELAANKEQLGGETPFQFNECLEFKDVKFFYKPETPILSGINIFLKRGEMLGVVGKSGAGKTTIADLLLRLVKPSGGSIALDGVDISQINMREWRKNIAYVVQDMFVFNDTIENNIRFYEDAISNADIHRAASEAYIYDFIQTLPRKFETEVGERGVLLSGGEKQRLVLSRALAKNPKILILDEATSALDNESELMIQRAIEGLKGKMTIFVIAHRLTTLLNCDKIIFLENGKISEKGSPRELLEDKDSSFYRLYNIRGNN